MTHVSTSVPLIARVAYNDVIIGTLTFGVDGKPEVNVSDEGLRLAAEAAHNILNVPDSWAFNPWKKD